MGNEADRPLTNLTKEDLTLLIQAALENREGERDAHWTIKVFGGAFLSVVAIILIGAFQSTNQSIRDCDNSVKTLATTTTCKEEFNSRTQAMWMQIKDLSADKAEIAALKERVKILEQQVREAKGKKAPGDCGLSP